MNPAPTPPPPRTLAINVLLILVTAAVYAQVTRLDFIVYDDPLYVTGNPNTQRGLSWSGFFWAFFSLSASNWHPLTWLSHMLDCTLFGLKPAGHHAVNLLFHIANTLLLFRVLSRMTGAVWRSAFVAAFFAWHPLHVESVAWVAERKDVLSAFFWLLTLLAYKRWVEKPGAGRYAAALACFTLGLLAKPMVVTLPFVLLLLDVWPLKRLPLPGAGESGQALQSLVKLCLEKISFFALTAGSCLVTFLAQKEGHSVASMDFLPLSARLTNALVAYADYLYQLIWPARLAVFYPLQSSHPTWKLAAAIVTVAGVTALALRWVRLRPYLLVGWLWYVGTLVPVIGIVQVGDQARADRYTYIPLIGIGVMLVWGAGSIVTRWNALRLPVVGFGTVALAGWVLITGTQVSYWKDTRTLFTHAASVTTGNNVAYNVLGNQLIQENPPRIEEAKQLFLQSLAIRPNDAGARHCLGDAFKKEGNLPEAITQYRAALRLDPNLHETHNGLGVCLLMSGQTNEAVTHFQNSIRIAPDYYEPVQNIALLFSQAGRLDEAAAAFERLHFLKPDSKAVLLGLVNVLLAQRKFAEAVPRLQLVLQRDPASVEALNRLAWIYATHEDARFRNGPEAIRMATQACGLTGYQHPQSLNTLAAAFAETGRFDEAVQTAQKALALAQAVGQTGLAGIFQNLLQLYQARMPYRDVAK